MNLESAFMPTNFEMFIKFIPNVLCSHKDELDGAYFSILDIFTTGNIEKKWWMVGVKKNVPPDLPTHLILKQP